MAAVGTAEPVVEGASCGRRSVSVVDRLDRRRFPVPRSCQTSLLVFALLMTLRGTARAQTVQLWPEVSTFIKMTDSTRLYLLATTVRG